MSGDRHPRRLQLLHLRPRHVPGVDADRLREDEKRRREMELAQNGKRNRILISIPSSNVITTERGGTPVPCSSASISAGNEMIW